MIPALPRTAPPSALSIEFLAELRLRGFEGDLSSKDADRTVFATDNSIYQVAPQAIAFPRHPSDVALLAKVAGSSRFSALKLGPRGGGTGTNGQSLTDGIVVDLSRHMNRIISVDPEARWAWVEAGVVKDQLNDAVRKHGLFFAPELSPSNRATIGGMIATDASGQGSVLYGKTRDHVLELDCVFIDGTQWRATPLAPDDLEAAKGRDDLVGAAHRAVDRIVAENAELISDRFPKLTRCVTGYDLVHVRDSQGRFHLGSVVCGAEGTLAFVTAAKVNLVPIPRHSAVVSIRYGTFDAALRDARVLMQLEAASSETVDSTVLGLARGDPVWLKVAEYFPEDAQGQPQGVNLVEFIADTPEDLARKLARVEALLAGEGASDRRGYTIAREPSAIAALWSMRKKSVGLLGNMPGEKRPMPFVEDTVVPPEHLADYIAEFRGALDRRGLAYGMFGHVDAGCLHVRPALDLKDSDEERLIREITDEVYALTRKYKGVLWGEHGKGVRSEYAPDFFGPLYPRMQEIKAAFDPSNQLNPGKIAAPPGQSLLRIDEVSTRGGKDRLIPIGIRATNQDSLHCNGNAACFNYDPDDAMCPSWKGTRERRHSPKGRASLMREWLRRMGEEGVDPDAIAKEARGGPAWLGMARRLIDSWIAPRRNDFSHEVKEAMDGCLACKSCVGQCPIKVDVPAFRSRFLELYHGRYLRPPRDLAVASLEQALPVLSPVRALANAALSSWPGRKALEMLGLVALPEMSPLDLRRAAASRGVLEATPAALRALSNEERRKSVVVVQDAFTSYYDTDVVLDFLELLRRLGFRAWLAPYRPNGKPLHVLGFLGRFERAAAANATVLKALEETGVDLVGVDPSMTLTYRSEYVRALGKERCPAVHLSQEWLARRLEELPTIETKTETWTLLPHCTERTNAAESMAAWGRVFRRLGVDLRVPPTGCCGMAGLYGHQKEQRGTSETIYRQSWAAHVGDPAHAGRLMATGYSCRTQASIADGVHLPHPVQVLLERVSRA